MAAGRIPWFRKAHFFRVFDDDLTTRRKPGAAMVRGGSKGWLGAGDVRMLLTYL